MALVRVLAGILTRNLEVGESAGKKASSMLGQVIPFLLSSSGLEATATEVQQYALTTLLSIIKKSSGKHLRPFIPDLVERMLALLSSLEPEAVNYIHLNASKYDLTEEKVLVYSPLTLFDGILTVLRLMKCDLPVCAAHR